MKNGNLIIREYDSLNRVVKKTENNLTTLFTYDIEGYQEKTIDPKENEIIKKYDKTGKLIEVKDEATYVYNLDGTVEKVTYQNGATEEYFYNADKTLQKLMNTYGTVKKEYLYTYDNNKNIISKTENEKEKVYTYDVLNRLKTISVVENKEKTSEKIETLITTYSYDKAGNRIKEVTGSITKDYVYNDKNQVTKITEKENGVITNTTIYTYDKNGNLLTEKVNNELKVTNVYNSKNELIQIQTDKEVNYIYNPEGKRIEKIQNSNKVKYVYEGLNIILELDNENNVIAKNTYGLSLISRNTDKKGYYLYNGHGDTITIMDNENNVLNNYTYDEWGVIIKEEGDFENPYRYAGYYYDTETNHYYLLSRYYNPEIGRFISEDSYRGDYNDPLSLNRYVYVTNNPLIYIDPEGYFGERIGKFITDLWEETKNVGITLGATIHGSMQAIGDMTIGFGQMLVDSGSLLVYGSAGIGNEIYHNLGLLSTKEYERNLNHYTDKIIESGRRLNPLNIVEGVKNNFATTFNINNLNNFLNKDTSYFDKVGYASEATKTVATIYGGYKVEKGLYDKLTQVNTAGTLKVYESNISNNNIVLERVSGYENKILNNITFNAFQNGKNYVVNINNTNVKIKKQGNHILDDKNYIEGKSIFNGTLEDAQNLINQYKFQGTVAGNNKIRVNFGKNIGKFLNQNGIYVDTSNGIIHFSKKGVHIVPSKSNK